MKCEIASAKQALSRAEMLYDSLFQNYADKLMNELEQQQDAERRKAAENPWLTACAQFKEEQALTEAMARALIERVAANTGMAVSFSVGFILPMKVVEAIGTLSSIPIAPLNGQEGFANHAELQYNIPKHNIGGPTMDYGYTQQLASPLRGEALEELKSFLSQMELRYAPGIEHTALIRDSEGSIAATASLEGNVIKCVAVDPAGQGQGLTAPLLTALRQKAMEEGRRRLFLYTKPENRTQFSGMGFWEVARTDRALLMEDKRKGFETWADSIRAPQASGILGAAVMNCNPMTLGHLYLIEQAAANCDFLYLFIVSEDKSAVPAEDRKAIVEAALSRLEHISVAATGQYLISSATFPDYFLKDKNRAGEVWTDMDAAVFLRLAERLGISRRFVGSEPFCPVTNAYNQTLARVLPPRGVELVELPRLEREGIPISATAVRELVRAGRWQDIEALVPPATFAWFSDGANRERFLARLS